MERLLENIRLVRSRPSFQRNDAHPVAYLRHHAKVVRIIQDGRAGLFLKSSLIKERIWAWMVDVQSGGRFIAMSKGAA